MARQEERVWPARLRWRMKGAWLWPTFVTLTAVEAVILTRLPFYGTRGPGSLVAGALLAGFFNLFLVAVVTPVAGWLLRRRRGDLPRVVAQDAAGTRLLVAGCVTLVVAGIAHRPVIREEREDRAAQLVAVHNYVLAQAPQYRAALAGADVLRVEEDMYRTCLPSRDPRRWLCVIVTTDQQPPGVRLDRDRSPNSTFRVYGGFD